METGDDWQLTERVRASARSAKGDPFAAAVRATRMAMIITDPRRLDNPIVYANDAFLRLTGYTRLEVTGRNCRFLQGPETDLDEVARIRAAIDAEHDVRAELVNYRKDGSTFHNALYISPVHDEDGTLLFFFASQFDATERRALAAERDTNALLLRAIGHRAGDDLRTVAAMLARRSEASADPAVRAVITDAIDRVEALGALYRAPAPDGGTHDELAERLRAIATARIAASGRDDIELACDVAPFPIRTDAAALLMPILNAAVADAVRRAPSNGRIALHLAQEGETVVVTIEGDGIGAAATDDGDAANLIDALIHPIGGTCTRHPAGTAIEVRFPG